MSSEEESAPVVPGLVIDNDWSVGKNLGKGGFGYVHVCSNKSSGHDFAMKYFAQAGKDMAAIENIENAEKKMRLEVAIMTKAKSNHLPQLFHKGKAKIADKAPIYFVIMTLLGRDLQDVSPISVHTAFRIGVHIIQAIRDIHHAGYVHRDIKPGNIVCGRNDDRRSFYLIDFGLCKDFKDKNGVWRPERSRAPFKGSFAFCSPYTHVNFEAAPRDDFFILLYTLYELIYGVLPWKDLLKERRRVMEDMNADIDDQKRELLDKEKEDVGQSIMKMKLNSHNDPVDPVEFKALADAPPELRLLFQYGINHPYHKSRTSYHAVRNLMLSFLNRKQIKLFHSPLEWETPEQTSTWTKRYGKISFAQCYKIRKSTSTSTKSTKSP